MAFIYFHRDYRKFSGGHLKVRDYFEHALAAGHDARIHLSARSIWDERNPWWDQRARVVPSDAAAGADLWFLAGMDWESMPEGDRRMPPAPVINLIQGVRHAQTDLPLSRLLSYPAVRVCVSPQVAQAIDATGMVNGPVIVIDNGIDRSGWPEPRPWETRERDVLIVGYKQPTLATKIAARCSNAIRTLCLTQAVPRSEFLELLANTRVVVCLPKVSEGFYLPALEAMAQQALTICPDCIGNREFCRPGETALVPALEEEPLAQAVRAALTMPDERREAMQRHAQERAAWHSLERERKAFHRVLADLPSLWRQVSPCRA